MLDIALLEEDGRLTRLKYRLSRKTVGAQPPPDLFSIIAVTTEVSRFGVYAKETVVEAPSPSLSYEALRAASELAGLLEANGEADHPDHVLPEILSQALPWWVQGKPPNLVLLKAIYLFAKMEGYPVAAEWRANLPPAEREAANALLGHDLSGDQPVALEPLPGLLARLALWIEHATDLRYPKP